MDKGIGLDAADQQAGVAASRSSRFTRLALIGCAILLAMGSGAARAQDMGYVKDLPTPAEIERRFAVADKEQSLGRQCAALDMLWRGTRFFSFAEIDKPPLQAARKRYLDAIAVLRERYAREVRPLDTPQAQWRWRDRLCANARDGVHPITSQPDASFPGLKQPVQTDEIVALFKPSVKAAHARMQVEAQAAREMAAAQQAAMARRHTASTSAARTDVLWVLLASAAPVVGLGLLALLLVLAMRRSWSFDAARGELTLGTRSYTLRPLAGVVTGRPTRSMETVVSGGGGGGGPNNAPVSVSISSHTVVHDQLFLTDAQGRAHALALRGWSFPCDEGHRVVAAWLERKGKTVGDSDDPLLLCNATVNASWTNRVPLMQRLGPLHPWATGAVLIAATLLTGGIGLLLTLPMWIGLSRLNRRRADAIGKDLKAWALRTAEGVPVAGFSRA